MPGPGGPFGPTETRDLLLFVMVATIMLLSFNLFLRQYAGRPVASTAPVQTEFAAVSREAALAQSPRVRIDTPAAEGSINLTGARFDDLSLKNYRQKVEKGSPEVALLTPQAAKGTYDSYFGWTNGASGAEVVNDYTKWAAPPGARLMPQTPLILTYQTPDNLLFIRTISVDSDHLFTITDKVQNRSGKPAFLSPHAIVRRRDLPGDFLNSGIVHQGLAGVFGAGRQLHEIKYDKARGYAERKATSGSAPLLHQEGVGGWLGISDHYWLTALIPPQTEMVRATFDASHAPNFTEYRADYAGAALIAPPNGALFYTQHFFAGAKRLELLQAYEKQLGVPDLDRAIDWGNFWFLTRPLFWLLDTLGRLAGNIGAAILLATMVIRLAQFPLAHNTYAASLKTRMLQPKLKEIQERFAADKQRQQQETMALYQREKVNPLAGCLPALLQFAIGFALFKVITVSIEMRHAPFFGWIHDLSARDPTTIFNLFGALPFDPLALPLIGMFLGVGVWPILNGAAMWGAQALSPAPLEPTQAQILKWMPVVLTFVYANLAAGIAIYYAWSSTLTIAQQYVILRRHGEKTELDNFIGRCFARFRGSDSA